MAFRFALQIAICLFSANVLAAVLVEDPKPENTDEVAAYSLSSKMSSRSDSLRMLRRLGVGWMAMGPTGLVGLQTELNFSLRSTVAVGAGLGDIFQSFFFSYRHYFEGRYILPFIEGGVARWYSVGNRTNITESNPYYLADRFLSKKSLASGKFAETLLFPGIGLNYVEPNGDTAGLSFFVALYFLLDLTDVLAIQPTAGIGMNYYF